jgi:hypothetical protein
MCIFITKDMALFRIEMNDTGTTAGSLMPDGRKNIAGNSELSRKPIL